MVLANPPLQSDGRLGRCAPSCARRRTAVSAPGTPPRLMFGTASQTPTRPASGFRTRQGCEINLGEGSASTYLDCIATRANASATPTIALRS
jgi:hypothetical protein